MNILFVVLIMLIFLSAFFSSSETALMSLNRYRLRHLVRNKHRTAKLVSGLLERTDRLLSVILIGNTFANILASAIATMIAVHLWGQFGAVLISIVLSLIVLIFAEIAPKTLAVLYPQRVSFLFAWPLYLLQKVLFPVVWIANSIASGLLRLLQFDLKQHAVDRLSSDELRTVVLESTGKITHQHQDMLLRLLDLEKMTVDDVMVPRNEILGIDLDDPWPENYKKITNSTHSLLPIYREDIDNIEGVVNLRNVLKQLSSNELTEKDLLSCMQEGYFIPEGTELNVQILNFRSEHKRMALVVDEYGDIQGLITIEDILEEIVGELASNVPTISKLIQTEEDGSYIIDGGVNIRELNRLMHWELPIEEAKTLSGVIVETIETTPQPGSSLLLNGYPTEIVEVKDNLVKSARISPRLRQHASIED